MIRITFDPAKLSGAEKDWWDRWEEKAKKEGARTRKKKSSDEFKSEIWRELKDWLLLNVFSGKCAYCESLVEAGFFGDGEHYRPKGKVCVRRNDVLVEIKAHPGYYWLAYNWKNLVPSCQRCNTGTGKGTQFPVEKTHIDTPNPKRGDPEELDRLEEPLLLHPYFDEPDKHLQFGIKGVVVPRNGSRRGAATIAVCDLERDGLKNARAVAQEDAWKAFLMDMATKRADQFLTERKGRPYFLAVRDYLRLQVAAMNKDLG